MGRRAIQKDKLIPVIDAQVRSAGRSGWILECSPYPSNCLLLFLGCQQQRFLQPRLYCYSHQQIPILFLYPGENAARTEELGFSGCPSDDTNHFLNFT